MPTELYSSIPTAVLPLPLHVLGTGKFSNYFQMLVFTGTAGFASGSWPTNNLAVYFPISLPSRFTVSRFFAANGSNATGNTDIGLYSSGGTLLSSTGTTARALTTVVQYIAASTVKTFPAGHYYLAMVLSSTTGQAVGSVISDVVQAQACGLLQEVLGGTVLPSTMTPVRYTGTVGWNFGFTQSATL